MSGIASSWHSNWSPLAGFFFRACRRDINQPQKRSSAMAGTATDGEGDR